MTRTFIQKNKKRERGRKRERERERSPLPSKTIAREYPQSAYSLSIRLKLLKKKNSSRYEPQLIEFRSVPLSDQFSIHLSDWFMKAILPPFLKLKEE